MRAASAAGVGTDGRDDHDDAAAVTDRGHPTSTLANNRGGEIIGATWGGHDPHAGAGRPAQGRGSRRRRRAACEQVLDECSPVLTRWRRVHRASVASAAAGRRAVDVGEGPGAGDHPQVAHDHVMPTERHADTRLHRERRIRRDRRDAVRAVEPERVEPRGDVRVFLSRLSATDTVVLGDIWTRFLAADAE
jgi:hypothetical protein